MLARFHSAVEADFAGIAPTRLTFRTAFAEVANGAIVIVKVHSAKLMTRGTLTMCHTVTMRTVSAFIADKPVIALIFFLRKAFIADAAVFAENFVVLEIFFTFIALSAMLSSLFRCTVNAHHASITIIIADAVYAAIAGSAPYIKCIVVFLEALSALRAMFFTINCTIHTASAVIAPLFIFFFNAVFAFAAVGTDLIILIARSAIWAVVSVIRGTVHALLAVGTPFIETVLAAIAIHACFHTFFFEARAAFTAMKIFTAI